MSRSLILLVGMCLFVQAARSQGGFREVLEIVGLEPTALGAINPDQPTADDWQIISQIVARLDQHEVDLGRWSKPRGEFGPDSVGELFNVEGTIESIDKLTATTSLTENPFSDPSPSPAATASDPPKGRVLSPSPREGRPLRAGEGDFGQAPSGLEPTQLYRCHLKLTDGREATVLSVRVPKRWELGKPVDEPVSLRGVLLRAEGVPLLLTNHVSWHPRKGVLPGKLLLARFGMDAALWDDVVQRTKFVSPEKGREAQAFYAVLSAITKVPAAELAALALESIADTAAAMRLDTGTNQERQIAAAVVEQAALGLSSVAPLFLNPRSQAGQLVRIEGTARRAVRIVADDSSDAQPIREYYEVEVFTADSQNLPIVCLVTQLPAGFPMGDAIRAGVRVDGVFFKLWRYHSRKTKATAGETATQQASYTPVVMAATVTWLKQATTPERWWGLAVGGIVFLLVIGGLLRVMFASRTYPRSLKEDTPDFSKLSD